MVVIIIIIINEFHRDESLKQNFRAAVCGADGSDDNDKSITSLSTSCTLVV